MTPVIPYSTSGISLIPGCTFETRKTNGSIRCCNIKKSAKRILYAQDCVLPLLTSLRLFPHISSSNPRFRISSATGVDVAVEQADQPETQVSGQDSGQKSESGEESPAKSKQRSRPVRKSDMPPVKDEELVPGATFTGKVRSIQPFGAFIDFGAFTDGLVHVSRLSDGYVKDVSSVVSVGQEVKVKLVEANTETGRIALTMRENEPAGGGDTSRKGSKPGQNQRSNPRKTTKFVKGQDLDGTVKNLTRSGAFISLPEGEEGFLPASEEADEGFGNIMGGGSSLEIGQEVKVRVLRIARGQVTLTMKKDEDSKALDSKLQGKVFTATNPFLVAFRKNQDIASFLDEREKVEDTTEVKVDQESQPKSDGDSSETETTSSLVVEDEKEIISSEPETKTLSSEDTETTSPEPVEDENVPEEITSVTSSTKEVDAPVIQEDIIEESQPSEVVENKIEEPVPEVEVNAEIPVSEVVDNQIEETAPEIEVDAEIPVENGRVEAPRPSETATKESQPSEVVENKIEEPVPEVEVNAEIPASEVVDNQIEETAPEIEVDAEIPDENGSVEAPPPSETATKESQPSEVVENKIEEPVPEVEVNAEIPASEVVDNQIEETAPEIEVDAEIPVENGSVEAPPPSETATKESQPSEVVENKIEEPVPEVEVNAEIPASEVVDNQIEETAPEIEVDAEIPVENGSVEAPPPSETATKETLAGEVVENKIEETAPEVEEDAEIPAATPVEDESVVVVAKENGGSSAPPPSETATKATISPALVKQLREETGAGMMDCKKALSETGGDLAKAQEHLRKKGLASADKKSSRATAEGRIGSYVHDSRIGVLVEVNCETDFVSRGEIFKELVNDLAMQVAACPQVQYLTPEDVSEEIVKKEKEIEMQKEDLLSKPEQFRLKIVEGRIKKRLDELALLEQAYIKNDKVVVKDFIKSTIATIGENIKVKRFVRFNLGEGLEKRSQDFAAEVAAQTAAKKVAAPEKDQPPPATEPIETANEAPKVTISAALVKQLREESGAGMMDCKKALSETGGDLEKAQEYLRKKGLSTADKKSSRLAAEGRIGSYIHDSRIGVLIEVNCETDFVGRSEKFKELVEDLAMQVVACPKVEYVSIEDIPKDIVKKEKEIEMQREDILSKPESIREKIVDGRVSKRLGELALLEQAYLKDDSVLVKDLVKQTVAAIGENIKVRRFVRFTLGESSESKPEETESS